MAANSNNAYRLSKLLVDGGTYFARELTLEEIGKQGFTSFDSFLNEQTVKNTLQQLQRRKILNNEQMILLYPQASNVDINQLDITLLTCILVNCCQLLQPQDDAVKKLRNLRNAVYGHRPLFSIPDSFFQKCWTDIKVLLENGSNGYLKPACERFLQELIKRVESEVLSPDDGEKYLNGLMEWNTQMMESLTDKMQSQDTKLDSLNVSMSELTINQKTMNESLKELKDQQESNFDIIHRELGSVKKYSEEIMQRQQTHHLKGREDTDGKASRLHGEWLREKIRISKLNVQEVITTTETALKKGLETIPPATMVSIRGLLDEERMLVLKGLPGCGKTFLGLHVLGEKANQGYTPVVVQNCNDLKSLLKATRSSERRLVVLIDNVLGQFSMDKNELNVMNHLADEVLSVLQNSESLFVFTIRMNILKSVTTEELSLNVLLRSNFEIRHDTFNKQNLVRLYASMKDIDLEREQIQTLGQTQPGVIGFPFLCSHMYGNYENIKSLFQKPTDFIKMDLINCSKTDKTDFCVLLLVIMTGNHLNIESLSQYKTEIGQIKSKYQCFPVDKSDLQSVTEHFAGTYLQKEGGEYRFIHDCILEATYETALNQNPELLISFSPVEYINKFLPLLEQVKSTWEILIDRFSIERNLAEVAKCNLWRNRYFMGAVLNRSGTDIFFVSRNIEGASLFEYLCTYSSDSAIKQILRTLNKTDLRNGLTQFVIERALKAACSSGRFDILKAVLSFTHVQITDDLMMSAIESPVCMNMIKYLLDNGGNIQAKNLIGQNILHIALTRKKTELIDFLLNVRA